MDHVNNDKLIDFTKCDVQIEDSLRVIHDSTVDVVIDRKYIPTDELNRLKSLNKKKKRKKKSKRKTKIRGTIPVSQEDIDASPYHIYIVDKPGSYLVTENLSGRILIDADNVKLDLGGYTMQPFSNEDIDFEHNPIGINIIEH